MSTAGPNIVLFMTDSMDGRVMRHLGHSAAYTPNMDRLAARGTSFGNAYCTSPQCAPSRASYWSGQYVHRIEAWNNPSGLPLDAPTFGTHLEDAGYGVHVFGKTDYRIGGHSLKARLTAWMRSADIKRPHNPRPHPTTYVGAKQTVPPEPSSEPARIEYLPSNQHPTRLHQKDWRQIDSACLFLRNHAEHDPPYLLYPSTNVPHPPFRAARHWLDTIDPAAVTLPPYESSLHPVMDYMSVTKNTHDHFTDEEILAIRRHYFAMVAETDAMLGQVLDTLEETGQLDDTYIIFASDHGEMNMEHRQTLKNAMYEASARVPLIVAGPGLQQGVVSNELVSLIDLFPTLMDMTGLDHPEGLDGVSLLPLCRGDASGRPGYVFSEYHSNFSNTGIAMWREGPWKYIHYAGYDPQLFNLHDDPEEMHNLAHSRPDVVQRLHARLESLVDVDAADVRAKADDRRNFLAWRDSVTPAQYQQAMSNAHQGVWGPDDDKRLETWLSQNLS